jgi:hypothetical protein
MAKRFTESNRTIRLNLKRILHKLTLNLILMRRMKFTTRQIIFINISPQGLVELDPSGFVRRNQSARVFYLHIGERNAY